MRRIAQIKLDRYSRDWQSFSINQDHRVRGFKTIRLLDIKRSRKKALFFLSPLPPPLLPHPPSLYPFHSR